MESDREIISAAVKGLAPEALIAIKAETLRTLGGKVDAETPDARLVSCQVSLLRDLLAANAPPKQ